MNHHVTALKYNNLKENTGGIELFGFCIIPLKRVTDTSVSRNSATAAAYKSLILLLGDKNHSKVTKLAYFFEE